MFYILIYGKIAHISVQYHCTWLEKDHVRMNLNKKELELHLVIFKVNLNGISSNSGEVYDIFNTKIYVSLTMILFTPDFLPTCGFSKTPTVFIIQFKPLIYIFSFMKLIILKHKYTTQLQ